MAINKATQPNVDNSNPAAYPNAQIKDDTGSNDGTAVAQVTMSDQFEFFAKLMRLAGLTYNDSFDNEVNGYQYVNALIALAGKNDYILSLTSSSVPATPFIGVLELQTNIDILNPNEFFIGKASVDYFGETQLKGINDTLINASIARPYKAGDYVLLINTDAGMVITTLATSDNISVLVGEVLYLKAASQAEENAGAAATVATTPATNKVTFTKRVNGDDSVNYLAKAPTTGGSPTPGNNGLLSLADKAKLDALTAVRNVGSFSGLDVGFGSVGLSYAVSGDISSAVVASGGSASDSIITVTMAKPMANTNYFVRSFLQSQGNVNFDNDCSTPVFVPLTATTFTWAIGEVSGNTQNLRVHLEVVQIS